MPAQGRNSGKSDRKNNIKKELQTPKNNIYETEFRNGGERLA